ncbi:MAG: proteasome subunit beta [Actinobacteria bacterium]|nr:proteasome subunit beta [Actinomycetota bacterium]MBU1493665.1 proteasome subunit beta [Actinomycetota bacterium]MBU1864910.1 proteasome subunit beta [Actinomycetota bacterium]
MNASDLPGSFSSFLRARGMEPRWDLPSGGSGLDAPEGTTVLAFRYQDGVIMAGDRRATAGNLIAHNRVQKVFSADRFSAVAISGTAGIAIELIRLFQTELEHYEKLEGHRLSLEGKANYLASMIRRQLPMAFQGLAVIPLFAGYDEEAGTGRLFSFDLVGGRYEEIDYTATGSGGRDAKLYLRGAFRPDTEEPAAIRLAVEALVRAAEEDSATGGPDLRRDIYPNVAIVDADGFREVPEEAVATTARDVLGGEW